MKPFSEKALTEKAEKWEEKAFPEQGIDPDYAYDDVIEGFISGWRAREEDLRALLKGAAPLLKPLHIEGLSVKEKTIWEEGYKTSAYEKFGELLAELEEDGEAGK